MKIIQDWRRALLGYAFSGAVLAVLAIIAPVVSWYGFGYQLDPNGCAMVALALFLWSGIGRFIQQPDGVWPNLWRIAGVALLAIMAMMQFASAEAYRPSGPLLEPSSGAIISGSKITEGQIIAIAVPEIKRHEGVRLTAYRDPIGIPTICAGTTRGVRMGHTITARDCDRLITSEAVEYWRGVSRHMTEVTLRGRITAHRGAAWTDLTINIGIGAATKSTALRRLNAGDIPGSCKAMTWFNKAGGVIFVGLVTRRSDNYDLCMIGAAA
ncbi:MAG: lysozyme [Sphingomonadales bacterium]|nr:lysozyme [Sphingomonadales bacterium]